MANPTTNFGWVMPTSSSLVTNLPADFNTFGQGVDTTLAELKGGTTGQVLSKASGTDMDFTWVAQDDSNAIQNALLTTTGDTIYASAASTPARLGVGSTGQVLTVAGGVPSWATPSGGGMTLLSTTTTNTGSAYTISGLSTSYINLFLVWESLSCTAGSSITIGFAGGTGTGGGVTQGAVAIGLSGATNWKIVNDTQASGNCAQMWIYNYAASSAKPLQSVSGGVSAGYRGSGYMGFTDYASAITTFTVTLSAGTFSAGTLKVYGVS